MTSAIAVQHLLPPAPTSPLEIPICPCLPSLTVSTPQHHSLTSAPPVTSVTPVPSPAPISTAASPHSCDSTFSTQSCQVATPTEKRLTPQVLRRRRKPTLPQEYRADEPAVACECNRLTFQSTNGRFNASSAQIIVHLVVFHPRLRNTDYLL